MSTQGGNSAAWTFGPDAAAKAAQNRRHLSAWGAAPAADADVALSHGPDEPACVPATSCLRMPSMAAFASTLAPVSADHPALAAAQAKPNKGVILRMSVEYIRQLQQLLDLQLQRTQLLEQELRRVYEHGGAVPPALGSPASSASELSVKSADIEPRWHLESLKYEPGAVPVYHPGMACSS